MTVTDDKLRGCWDFDSGSPWGPQSEEVRKGREKWVSEYFSGSPPPFIWRAEFFEGTPGIFTMTLHRFAKDYRSSRYHTWVRAYDAHGTTQSVRLPATEAPEEFPLTAASPPVAMPSESLLLGNAGD